MITLRRFLVVAVLASATICRGAESSTSPSRGSTQGSSNALGGMNAIGNNNSNAGNSGPSAAAPTSVVTDPSYKLSVGDQIVVQVDGEPELNASQLIDRDGIVRLKVIDATKITGKTVREAEHDIEALYIERKILKKPVVTLIVTAFSPREVLVYGAVGSQGPVAFPRDAIVLDIVDVINRAGGFKPGAKSNAVTVRRKGSDGRETTSPPIDVKEMMFGGKRGEQQRNGYPVYPGDIINVEMSIF